MSTFVLIGRKLVLGNTFEMPFLTFIPLPEISSWESRLGVGLRGGVDASGRFRVGTVRWL